MDYLLKTEPTAYSFADLQRDKSTIWDGVSNPVALRNLREMKAGDGLLIYETGDHKSVMGTASVVSVDASDPKNPQVKIKVGKGLAKPVTLAEIKANKLFAGFSAGAAGTVERGATYYCAVQVSCGCVMKTRPCLHKTEGRGLGTRFTSKSRLSHC